METQKDPTIAIVISKFGSAQAVAEACKVTPGAVSQWTGIPAKHQATLLLEAAKRGIELSAEELIRSLPKNRRKIGARHG